MTTARATDDDVAGDGDPEATKRSANDADGTNSSCETSGRAAREDDDREARDSSDAPLKTQRRPR